MKAHESSPRPGGGLDEPIPGEPRERDTDDDVFLETLSQELREPLTALGNAAEVIRLNAGDDERWQWVVAMFDRELGRMNRVADDLLELARLAQGRVQLHLKSLDLEQALREAIGTVQPELLRRGLRLSVRSTSAPVPVWGDQARMVQLLTVLLDDIARHSPAGTTISVSLSSEPQEVALRIAGVPTAVEDHAPIVNGTASSVAASGWTQRSRGVGLTLVRRLLNLHGGNVALAAGAPDGEGEMVLRLPTPAAPPEWTQPVKAPVSTRPIPAGRILVVDDHRDTADALARVLELRGHWVLAVYGSRTALEALETFRPHVVLLDLGLPAMDGLEVARRIRARPELRHLILVAATGLGGPDERRRSFLAGFDHHLVKPVMPEQIEALLVTDAPNPMAIEPLVPPRPR